MYGKTTSSEGKSLENNFVPVETGLHVKGNQLVSIEIFKSDEGEEDPRRAILTVKQANGAELRHTIWDGLDKDGQVDAKAMDRLNGFMLHLGTVATGSVENYTNAIGSPSNFAEFINAFNTNVIAKSSNKRFTMTIIKRENTGNGKWYAQIPLFPNFIELDGTNPTTLFMKKSYIFEEPAVSNPDTANATSEVDEAF